MATKYLTLTGLGYFYNRLKTIFVAQETGKGLSTNDLTDALVTKINEGAANVIETVQLNGVALTPDANKAVNVTAPVQSVRVNTTVLTPDSNGQVQVAVPNLSASIGNIKEFHVWNDDAELFVNSVPNGLRIYSAERSGGEEAFDKTLPDETRVNAMITAAMGNITSFRYSLVASLPATGEEGVVYLVPNSGTSPNIKDEYIWVNTGTAESPAYVFEKIGTTEVNLSNYLQTTDIEAITTAEIDEIVAATTP